MKGLFNARNLLSEKNTYHADIVSAGITRNTGFWVVPYTCATAIKDIRILGDWWYILPFNGIDECRIDYMDKGRPNEGFNEREDIYHWSIAELTRDPHNSGPWSQSSLITHVLAMYLIHWLSVEMEMVMPTLVTIYRVELARTRNDASVSLYFWSRLINPLGTGIFEEVYGFHLVWHVEWQTWMTELFG